MREITYLLLGGGLASHHAAAEIRKRDTEGSIAIVGQEPYRPYNRPPLTKGYLRGEKPLEKVFVESPAWYDQHHVELILERPVARLDLTRKLAVCEDGEELHFEKLLYATGGRPRKLNLPGANYGRIHLMRTISDCQAILAEVQDGRQGAIVGAGFIGMELAASFRQRGLGATVIEAAPHVWPRFVNERLGRFFEQYYRDHGVELLLGEKTSGFEGANGQVAAITLESGRRVPCNFACVAVGIEPYVELADDAGLEVDNGVVVNERMQASHPDVYAAGDVANYPDPVLGRRRRVEHWGHAEYTGGLAGRNMAGAHEAYDFVTYVFSNVFDLDIEFAGDESQCDRVLWRGRPEKQEPSFIVVYVKDARVTAYFSVNGPKEQYQALHELIHRRASIEGRDRRLEDPSFDLRQWT